MDSQLVMIGFGVAATTMVLLLSLVVGGRKGHVDVRLAAVAAGHDRGFPRGPSQQLDINRLHTLADSTVARHMRKMEKREKLRNRVIQAGLYRPTATAVFVAIRIFLLAAPMGLGLLAANAGLLPRNQALLYGAVASGLGTIAPSMWLDHLKRSRQQQIRRALPDALDVIVVCLEGGLSLPAAMARVASELNSAHPMLALELAIVEREIQMGRTAGEALKQFAQRFDLSELRSLASVTAQAEKFGASVINALTVYADSMRMKRKQRAEELAQKASVKILIPTILCIFPAMYIVLLGPAAIQIFEVFIKGDVFSR